MRRAFIPLVILIALVEATGVDARTWHVPSGCPTIQAGVDSVGAGDTVLVACGTYYEHDIVMRSGVRLSSETGLADCVTIDAQQLGRVFFCRDIDTTAVFEGFTIAGGSAVACPDDDRGGGMFCVGASPTVRNCLFCGNSASDGGALICICQADARVRSCTFRDNRAEAHGGAVDCCYSAPLFEDCLFFGNVSEHSGGAFTCYSGSAPVLTRCVLRENSAGLSGGAAHSSACATLTFINCTLCRNSAGWIGGGVCSDFDGVVWLENSIVAYSLEGGAVCCWDGWTGLACCNLYGNVGGDWAGCISYFYERDGNFSECPGFCDPEACDFRLQECSPCAPGNHPYGYDCGLIGAHGVACPCGQPSAVAPVTWSGLKSLYR